MIKRIVKALVMVWVMFIGIVTVMKLLVEAFARFVLWTAEILGFGYE